MSTESQIWLFGIQAGFSATTLEFDFRRAEIAHAEIVVWCTIQAVTELVKGVGYYNDEVGIGFFNICQVTLRSMT